MVQDRWKQTALQIVETRLKKFNRKLILLNTESISIDVRVDDELSFSVYCVYKL